MRLWFSLQYTAPPFVLSVHTATVPLSTGYFIFISTPNSPGSAHDRGWAMLSQYKKHQYLTDYSLTVAQVCFVVKW